MFDTLSEKKKIKVEVAFALPDSQEVINFSVVKGCTAQQAVEKSGIHLKFPEIDFNNLTMGIFSRLLNGIELPLPADYVLEEEDRVEIYRPLLKDPKQARRDRAHKMQQKNKNNKLRK